MEVLARMAERLGIPLSSAQLDAFQAYYELLVRERERAGLTSLKEQEDVERRHFGEALALLQAIEHGGYLASPAIDLGSGAGFPGVPIKIMRPELRLTLLEATGKKARFLEQLARELGLEGVEVAQARAEELAHDPAHRERYALALARAVAPLRTLVELALPFLRLGGVLASPKGSGAQREAQEAGTALELCGGTVERIEPLDLPEAPKSPLLVIVRKTDETPQRFPRRPGVPSKRPL